MNENYTQAANSRCFGLVDSTLEEIWADIGRTPEDTEAALWKRKLQRIAAQYVLSSRFALMRILCERAGGGETGFTAALEGETLTFPDITAQHAQNLTERELQDYERLLMDIAARQAETERAQPRTHRPRAHGGGGEEPPPHARRSVCAGAHAGLFARGDAVVPAAHARHGGRPALPRVL